MDRLLIWVSLALAMIALILAWNKENHRQEIQREIRDTLREIRDKL
jgi:hypothetical protein